MGCASPPHPTHPPTACRYDAGDVNKFTFPAAWTLMVLSLGALEFSQGYQNASALDAALANIK